MVSDQIDSFGTLLRRYRTAAGLTQEGLAGRSGLGVRTIAYLEADRGGMPRSETVRLLADALDLSPQERTLFLAWARVEEPAALPTIGPAPAEPVLHPLIGRDAVLDRLDSFLQGEGPPVFLLAGEPGIGKTRLLRETARRAVAAGWTVLAGGARRQGGEAPYAPLLDALQQHLGGSDPRALRRILTGCAWLVRLLPELAPVLEPLPLGRIPPEHERRLMVDAIARLLRHVAGPAGTLLLLDDLQWAGPDALDLLEALVRHPVAPVRIVGAYRDTDVEPADRLPLLVGDLARSGLVAHQPLGRLDAREAAALLDSLLSGMPPDDPETVRRVLERAEGTPFFLVSYAQSLTSGGAETVPWDLATSIRQRIALAGEAAEVLGIGAVVGRRVPRSLLLAVAREAEEVLAGLEVACRARLLLEEGPDAYVFAHDVIREVIEEDLGAGRRAFYHARIAAALERAPASASPDVLAYHWTRAGAPDKAAAYLEAAGDQAYAQHAHTAAERSYRAAIEQLDGLGRTDALARVREKLGGVLGRAGQFVEGISLLEQAAEAYRTAGDFEREVRVTERIASGYAGICDPETGMARITALLERSPDASSSAALYGVLGQLLVMIGRYQEAWSATQRADELARESGDGYARLNTAWSRMHLLIKLGRMDEALPLAADIVHLAEDLGDLPMIIGIHRDLAFNLATLGEFETARVHIDRASAAVDQTGRQGDFLMVTAVRGWLAFLHGNWTEARADLEEATTPSGWGDGSWYATYPLVFLAHLRLAEGDVPAAAAAGNEALALANQSSDLQGRRWASAVLAELDLAQANGDGALARLQPLLDRGGLEEGDVTDFLPALARAYLDTGQFDRAREVAGRAIARARAESAKPVLAEALRVRALIAMQRKEWQIATQSLDEGLALARSMSYPYAEARILVELGLLDQHQDKPDGARERLAEALALFQRLGAAKDVERTAEILAGPSQNSEAPPSQNSPAAPSQKERDAETWLTDTQWARIASLLPPRHPGRGRPRADDRQTVEAILYVRRTGCAWANLPPALGSGATAHRRWQEWQAAALWDQIVALAETPEPGTGEEQW